MSDWSIYISLLIPHPAEAKILLVDDRIGWTLPRYTPKSTLTNLHLLQGMLRERFGAEITVLRAVYRHEEPTEQIITGLWLMENHTSDWILPQDAQWVDLDILANIPLHDALLHEPLGQAVATFHEANPVERVPWMRQGWFKSAQT